MLGINQIKITHSVLRQIADIDTFNGYWHGLEKHTTGLSLLSDVAEHNSELAKILNALKEQPITLDIILALYATQSKTSSSEFRKNLIPLEIQKNNIPIGMLDVAAAEDIEPLLSKLCDWTNDALNEQDLHPLLIATVFTAIFLQISPFNHGNQALLRFLLIILLLKAGYTYAPYISLAPIMEEQAEALHAALKNNQQSLEAGKPQWEDWLNVFLTILQTQKDILQTRIDGNTSEIKDIPELSARILALFQNHKRLQMKEIIRLTNGRRATIKLRLKELQEAGHLHRHGGGRSTWYSLV